MKRVVRMTLTIAIIAAGAYLALMLLVYLMQRRMVYFPAREITITPADVGLTYDEVTLTTPDNVTLSAWYVPADDSPGVILICHGNGGNIGHRVDLLRRLNRLGWSTLIFDYRGYGRSEGSTDEQGTYTDAQTAWDYLVKLRGVKPSRIVIHGRSLGGGVGSELAGRNACRGLILESTFTSLPDVAANHFRFLPARMLCRFGYRSIDRVKKITCPVLVIHSPDDEVVPYTLGQKLFEAARRPKTFLTISGDHNNGYADSGGVYTEGVRSFLDGLSAERATSTDE